MSHEFIYKTTMFARIPSPSALRTFEAAARLGSFKAAARELSVTPTAVSHQIRNLEEHLEVPLFIRRTRAVALTESGQRLSEAVHQAFQQITMALEDVSATETVLTVSTTPAFAALWLVPRLSRFEERHPRLRFQLVTSTTPTDLERDRVVDVAVRYGTGPYPRLRAHTLADEAFGAYATPDYIERLERWEDAELIETAWQLPGFEDVSWDAWLAAAGLSRPAKLRSRQFRSRALCRSGRLGLAGAGASELSSGGRSRRTRMVGALPPRDSNSGSPIHGTLAAQPRLVAEGLVLPRVAGRRSNTRCVSQPPPNRALQLTWRSAFHRSW